LQSGDQVEILTSKSQHVKPEWVSYATTAKAKAKIQAILRREQRGMAQAGEDMVHAFIEENGLPDTPDTLQKLAAFHQKETVEEFYAAVGMKTIVLADEDKASGSTWKKFIPFSFGKKSSTKQSAPSTPEPTQKIDGKKVIKLTPDAIQKNYVIADCCHPIPGDDVLGYLDEHNRLVIHKRQCPVAAKLKTSYGNRLVAVEWDLGKALYFPANIYIKGIDHIGLLNDVTKVISEQLNVNIHKLCIESNDGIFEGHIQLYVHDVEDVKVLVANLKKVQDVKFVTRTETYEERPN
jgi:GTP pyrophosphokinase